MLVERVNLGGVIFLYVLIIREKYNSPSFVDNTKVTDRWICCSQPHDRFRYEILILIRKSGQIIVIFFVQCIHFSKVSNFRR